jgi:hypothetical protein
MTPKKKTNPKLDALIRAFEDHDDAEAIKIARSHLKDPEKDVRLEATRILAASLFSTGEFGASCPVWLTLAEETNQGGDWLSVVTSHLRARRFEEADRYFEKAREIIGRETQELNESGKVWSSGDVTIPYLLGNYADAAADAGAPERAVPKIKELALIHAQLRIVDFHFLVIRGMTSFDSFVQLIERVYALTSKDPAWLEIFRAWEKLDDDGRLALQELRKRLGGTGPGNFPVE